MRFQVFKPFLTIAFNQMDSIRGGILRQAAVYGGHRTSGINIADPLIFRQLLQQAVVFG